MVQKNHVNVENVVDNINDLKHFKAYTWDPAKRPYCKKNN